MVNPDVRRATQGKNTMLRHPALSVIVALAMAFGPVASDAANRPPSVISEPLTVTGKLFSDAKINRKQWANVEVTYLGQNHDGDHRLQVHSKGFNDYYEKGNTLRIFTILEDAEGNPLYVHYEAIGVPSRTWNGREMRQRRSEILLNAEVANKIRSVRVVADNDGKSNRLQKAVEKIVADGVAQGATGAIAGSIKGLLIP